MQVTFSMSFLCRVLILLLFAFPESLSLSSVITPAGWYRRLTLMSVIFTQVLWTSFDVTNQVGSVCCCLSMTEYMDSSFHSASKFWVLLFLRISLPSYIHYSRWHSFLTNKFIINVLRTEGTVTRTPEHFEVSEMNNSRQTLILLQYCFTFTRTYGNILNIDVFSVYLWHSPYKGFFILLWK